MKKINYIFLFVVSLFVFMVDAKADCNMEEEKEKASKIEITYDINLDAYKDTGKYDKYIIRFNNLSNSLRVYDKKNNRTFTYYVKDNYASDKSYANDYTYGTHYFSVYSSFCSMEIMPITVKIPKFNEYSVDKLCEGISENELPICGKWFDNTNISYNDFVKTINNYKNNQNENSNNDSDYNNDNNEAINKDFNYWMEQVITFIKNNYLYVGIGFVVIVVLIITLIVIKNRRGRLE